MGKKLFDILCRKFNEPEQVKTVIKKDNLLWKKLFGKR